MSDTALTERQIAELVAAHEIALEQLTVRETALAEQFVASETFLNEQLAKINALMADLHEIMTETGAARLRLSAQEMLKQGDYQLQQLADLAKGAKTTLQESGQRFERTTESVIKQLQKMHAPDEVKDSLNYQYTQIKNTATQILGKIQKMLQWFQWKNLLLGLGIALLTAIGMGLYMNDEWPWEMHQSVMKQRAAGKALIKAWPQLSAADQQYLKQKSALG